MTSTTKALKISHVGIAVSDLEKAIADYKALFDFESVERVDVKTESASVAFLKAGETEIELLAPNKGEGESGGTIAKFIRDRGEGLHHIAIKVQDVSKAIEEARNAGLRVLDDKPRKAPRGAEAAFVHPKSFHGVLLEFYSR